MSGCSGCHTGCFPVLDAGESSRFIRAVPPPMSPAPSTRLTEVLLGPPPPPEPAVSAGVTAAPAPGPQLRDAAAENPEICP